MTQNRNSYYIYTKNEEDLRLKSLLRDKNPSSIAFIIGPEGGFSGSEYQ